MTESRQIERLSLSRIPFRPWYATGSADLALEFYAPCLRAAVTYDRAAGFFRSSVYTVSMLALADFVERGGHLRLICSPYLAEEDVAAIERGLSESECISAAIVRDIRQLATEPTNSTATQLLASLVSAAVLDIRIAFRPGRPGLFHSKIGLFESSDGAIVSFNGSANETGSAFSTEGNQEDIAVFTSWGPDSDVDRVRLITDYFNNLWDSRQPGLEVIPFPDVPRDDLVKLAHPDGPEAALDAIRVKEGLPALSQRNRTKLMDHQERAVTDWEARGGRGILTHATGAGKTITAIQVIRQWIQNGRSALTVVPSIVLRDQWRVALDTELADIQPDILVVGGDQSVSNWTEALPDFTRSGAFLGPRVVLATLQSASTARFRSNIVEGDHLLVVADEVHHAGSPVYRSLLTIDAGGRLGLSATPERFGDPNGTRILFDYFGSPLEPAFGLEEAIRCGRLVPYDYYVHFASLADDEITEWTELTKRIGRAYAGIANDNHPSFPPTLMRLLVRRAAIAKRAKTKPGLCASILETEMNPGDHWLVYCDTADQLYECKRALRGIGIDSLEYHSQMLSDRAEVLNYFVRHGGVLIAIRCLDEGVDIPLVDHALILASSSNPREFIQRRGRVLRSATGKNAATIHDVLVVPPGAGTELRPLLKVELGRAAQFSRSSRNTATSFKIRQLASQLGIDSTSEMDDFEDQEGGP